jgi:amidase
MRSPGYVVYRRRDLALSVDGGIAAMAAGSAGVLLAPMAAAAKCMGKAGAPVIAIPVGEDRDCQPFKATVVAMAGEDRLVLEAVAAIEQVVGRCIVQTGR